MELGRSLHGVWRENVDAEVSLLQELWSIPRKLERVLPIVARKMLQGMPEDQISHGTARKRRRDKVEEEKGRELIHGSKRRR